MYYICQFQIETTMKQQYKMNRRLTVLNIYISHDIFSPHIEKITHIFTKRLCIAYESGN